MASSTITISSSSTLNSQQVTRNHQSDGVDRLSKQPIRCLETIFGYLCPQNSVAELPKIFPKEYGAKEKEAQEKELNQLSSRLLAGGVAAIRYRVLSRHFNKSFGDVWCKTWSSGIVSAMPSLQMNARIMRQMVANKCVTLCQIYILVHPKTLGEKTDDSTPYRVAVINRKAPSLFRAAVIDGEDPALIKFFFRVVQKEKIWEVLFDGLSTIVDWNQDEIRKIEWHEPELRKKSPRASIEILNKKLASKNAGPDIDVKSPKYSTARSIKVYENQIAINEFMRRAPFKVRCKSFGIPILQKIMGIALIIFGIVVVPIALVSIPVLMLTISVPSIYVGKLLNHISQGCMTTKARKICSYVLGFIFSPIITPPVLLVYSCVLAREGILDRTRLNSTIKKILMIPLGIIIFPVAFPFAALCVIKNG